MRNHELFTGIEVKEKDGNVVGTSKIAARKVNIEIQNCWVDNPQRETHNSFCRILGAFYLDFNRHDILGPVARSLVSANRWLRGIKMYRFPWYLTLFSTNHASSNRARSISSLCTDVPPSTPDFSWGRGTSVHRLIDKTTSLSSDRTISSPPCNVWQFASQRNQSTVITNAITDVIKRLTWIRCKAAIKRRHSTLSWVLACTSPHVWNNLRVFTIKFANEARENSRHFATLPLFFPPNDVWETSAKFHTEDTWCVISMEFLSSSLRRYLARVETSGKCEM